MYLQEQYLLEETQTNLFTSVSPVFPVILYETAQLSDAAKQL